MKLLYEFVDAPVPEDNQGRPRVSYEALEQLTVGGSAIDINREVAAAHHYIYRYRVLNGREKQFKVRAAKPGWSRIWRVK